MTDFDARTDTVPAGIFFLGDPCYAVPDEHWQALLDEADHFDDSTCGTVAGHRVYAFSTGGDGCFTDVQGHEYPVDAGLIGLTPMALANPDADPEQTARLAACGRIVTFESPAHIDDSEGLLTFGPYVINTGEEPEQTCGGCCGELVLGLCDDCDYPEDDEEDAL